MAKSKKPFVEDRKTYDAIMAEVMKFKNSAVGVGVHEGEAPGDGGISVAQLAAVHEYGSPKRKIPERSFLRAWAAESKAKVDKLMMWLLRKVTGNEMKTEMALGLLGQFGEDGVKAKIDSGPFVPNSPRTIRQKKSSKPLIDTRHNLYSRIKWKIFHGGQIPNERV